MVIAGSTPALRTFYIELETKQGEMMISHHIENQASQNVQEIKTRNRIKTVDTLIENTDISKSSWEKRWFYDCDSFDWKDYSVVDFEKLKNLSYSVMLKIFYEKCNNNVHRCSGSVGYFDKSTLNNCRVLDVKTNSKNKGPIHFLIKSQTPRWHILTIANYRDWWQMSCRNSTVNASYIKKVWKDQF